MGLEDIEKLKARLEKDPSSKLFVPLAEEYRKAGMYDEAIEVLLNELRKEPTYTTARVSLAKIYLEKGMTAEARKEFEQVVASVPDNLFAQKKLAELYKSFGDTEKAAACLRKVIELNPRDEEAKATLEMLSGGGESLALDAEALETMDDQYRPEASLSRAVPFDPAEIEDPGESAEGHEEAGVLEAGDDVVEALELPEGAAEAEEAVQEEGVEIVEEGSSAFEEYEEFSRFVGEEIHDMEEAPAVDEEGTEPPVFAMLDEVGAEKPPFESREERDYRLDDMLDEFADSTRPPSSEVDALLRDADGHIDSGQYVKAIEIYSGMLSSDPGNRRVRQRMEELKYYLKMIGKDPDTLVSRLEGLYGGLKNRRDEFFGST